MQASLFDPQLDMTACIQTIGCLVSPCNACGVISLQYNWASMLWLCQALLAEDSWQCKSYLLTWLLNFEFSILKYKFCQWSVRSARQSRLAPMSCLDAGKDAWARLKDLASFLSTALCLTLEIKPERLNLPALYRLTHELLRYVIKTSVPKTQLKTAVASEWICSSGATMCATLTLLRQVAKLPTMMDSASHGNSDKTLTKPLWGLTGLKWVLKAFLCNIKCKLYKDIQAI